MNHTPESLPQPPSSQVPTCRLPLETPPRVVFAGGGLHGRLGRATRDSYVLPGLWAIHLYLSPARITILGKTLPLHPGDVSLTPMAEPTTYDWEGQCSLLCSHFFVPAPPATGMHAEANVPVVIPVNQDFGPWRDRMEAMIGAHGSPKASAILWTLLWELHDRAIRQNPRTHPILEHAREWIELHLNKSIRVAELASHLSVSHTHLTMLFRRHEKCTVVEYIRARRASRARHLLENTTQPIKSIAMAVGVGNLQRFNKLMRLECGKGPRSFRKASNRA